MLTQIEIDGFKTFKDFKVELAPFQVIVGPNGSGKSNLFDALHLLSRLADTDLLSAFQEMRGEVGELFTKLPEGKSVDRMRMAVEMLVDRKVEDDFGRKAELKFTRLRYEVEIILGTDAYGLERLYVTHESLKSIPQAKDDWRKKFGFLSQSDWLPEHGEDQAIFIDTKLTPVSIIESIADKSKYTAEQALIYLYPDSDEQQRIKRFYTREVQRTVLSRETDTDYPHPFAAYKELRSLKFLHLNPAALRQPSSVNDRAFLASDGRNLPATLARMQAMDKFALTDVSRDMANLVPGISKIRVEKNQAANEYDIWAETSDHRSFSAQVLSDGTLRLLALATLRNDLEFHGVLCLEEPENGVQPLYLNNMVRILREMATDFNDPQQIDEPLRQVLVTTHSPTLISLPEVIDSVLFAHIVTRGASGQNDLPMRITRMVPVLTPNIRSKLEMDTERDRALEVYTIDMVRKYLSSDNLDAARDQLEKARLLSVEGKAQ